ncbi:putative reverse transcriptase domain-containing protein [Tanacetum coccineum]
MSDSEDSSVTYIVVSSPFRGLMLEDPYAYVVAAFQAPPSPDYVSGPEYPPSPEFVPEPVYPEFMPLEDEILPAEEQPLPATVSPTADSPGYVPESDHEGDPEEDDDEDPEEDLADYPADEGDDGNDEDESSDDEDVDIEGAPSAEETEPFKTDESAATPPPHPAYRVTARISIRDEPPTPLWSDTEVVRLLAIPTPPPSPLSPWSSPLPQIPSPPLPLILSPLPVSPPLPVSSLPPGSPIHSLGYRAAMIRLRAEAPSTSYSPPPHIILSYTRADTPPSGTPPSGTPPLLPIPLPTSSPPLNLLSTDRRVDRPEVTLSPWKRLGIALGPRYEVGESSSAAIARPSGGLRAGYGFVATVDMEIMRGLERDVGYGITDTWDEMLVDMPGAPATDDTELGGSTAGSDYRATGSGPQETSGDYKDVGSRPQEIGAVHRGTKTAEETSNTDDRKMAPKRATRSNLALETTNTTSVTNAQLQVMINQGIITALAARDADRNTNGDDSHISGVGARKELLVNLNGLKEWSLFSTSVIVQLRIKSSLLLALSISCFNMVEHPCQDSRRMFLEKSDKIENYVGGLPGMIHGSVVASKPKTMQDAVEITTELMDKKIRTFAKRQTESKRKFEDTSRNTQNQQQQQQQNKRQNIGSAYTTGTGEKKPYGGSKPLCSKCNYHHDGPCAPKCHKCNKVGHFARDCRSTENANNVNNEKGTGSGQKPTL